MAMTIAQTGIVNETTDTTTAEAAAKLDSTSTSSSRAKKKKPNKAARTEQSRKQQKVNELCKAALLVIAGRIGKARDTVRLTGSLIAQAAVSEEARKTGKGLLARFRLACEGFTAPGMPEAEITVGTWKALAAGDITVRLPQPFTLPSGSVITEVRSGKWLEDAVSDILSPSTSKQRLDNLVAMAEATREVPFNV
jgi:hypothetical protein